MRRNYECGLRLTGNNLQTEYNAEKNKGTRQKQYIVTHGTERQWARSLARYSAGLI